MSDLHAVNTNLLVALDALLLERHVGRAAQRVGVTQSAMSHSLRQLRELLEDPILVRAGQKMLPTPRAEAIAPILRGGVRAFEQILTAHEEPEPSTFTQEFVLAIQDLTAAVMLPELTRRMREQAPDASLSLVAPSPSLGEALEQGRVHAAFIPPVNAPSGLRSKTLESENARMVVLGRDDHPALQGPLDLDTFCAVPHAMMTITGVGTSWVDDLLAQHGRTRRVALRMPYGLAIPSALLDTDLVVVMPLLVTHYFTRTWPMRTVDFPVELPFLGGILVAWHERYENEPAYRWFRGLVEEAAVATG
jgi:DNA-binding transcriptional LysR family regulator